MKQILFSIKLLVWVISIYAQPFVIQSVIQYADGEQVFLASFEEDHFQIIDTSEAPAGSFHFILPGQTPAGVYRLIYREVYKGVLSENRFVEFIFNQEDLLMNVAREEPGPVPYFEHSLENSVYSRFVDFQLDYEAELTKTYRHLFPAEPGNPVYEAAVANYESLQLNRIRFMDSLTTLYPGLYATRIINAFRAPLVPGSMTHSQRIDTLKSIFFENAFIDDPGLLRAPVYNFRIVDYLSLYKVDSLDMEEQEEAFKEAVDHIMVNVSDDADLRYFVVEFLLEGFEMLGMETVILHIAENYLEESCESDLAELVRDRMEGYKKMAIGSRAPDFVIRDMKGRNIRLSELPNSYVVVVFWSSTCGHCREMVPELHKWYMEENSLNMEVVAISLDSSFQLCSNYTGEIEMEWITSHDPLGWNGKVPGDYFIFATPTLFLLDRERKILAKPVTFRQFRRTVSRLEPAETSLPQRP